MTITPVLGEDGAITHFVAIKQDVTPRKRQEEVIQSLATRDLLTGLPEPGGPSRGRSSGSSAPAPTGPAAASSCSTSTGSRCSTTHSATPPGTASSSSSRSGSNRLLPTNGRLYRFGGDEFAVLLEGSELSEAETIAEALRASIDGMRFASEGVVFDVTASLGVVPVEPSRSAAATLALADAALHIAKDEGRNRCVTCREDPAGRRAMDDLGRWAARVRDALRTDRLRLLAQRIVSLRTGETEHEELLVRLVDDSGGLIAPGGVPSRRREVRPDDLARPLGRHSQHRALWRPRRGDGCS